MSTSNGVFNGLAAFVSRSPLVRFVFNANDKRYFGIRGGQKGFRTGINTQGRPILVNVEYLGLGGEAKIKED